MLSDLAFGMSRTSRADRLPGADKSPGQQGRENYGPGSQRSAVTPGELAKSVCRRWWARLYRIVLQVMLDISRQTTRRVVAAVTVLVQTLHYDPIQLAAD